MFRILIPATAALMLATSPALAGHCPVDIKKVDEALASTDLSASDLAKVKGLRAKGESMHKTGKHAESLEALHEAMEILGIDH
ncbi:MAG: hypothetical protein RIC16_08915 [Rhodospirillales bacterium]